MIAAWMLCAPMSNRFWCALIALALPSAAVAQRTHTISGKVTSDSGTVIAAADVIVTVAPSAETILGKTDVEGAYRIVIPNATGEYILNISALGFRPFRQRVTIPMSDTGTVVNAKLVTAVQQVAAVRVQAARPRPPRSLGTDAGGQPTADGTNKLVDGVTNALPPELQGNIDAMAALVPGLSVTPGGFSTLGLGADANMRMVNGMQFAGDAIPRDMQTSTRFATSPWDPTRGGFSGALSNTTIAPGGNIATRRGRVTLDAPPLQVADPIASRFGQTYTNLYLGGGARGAITLDKYFYNIGYQGSINRASVSSLLDLDDDALSSAGISRDSAARLIQIAGTQGVPLTTGGVPDHRTTKTASITGRFDRMLPNTPGAKPLPQSYVILGANVSQTGGSSLSPTNAPANTGNSSRHGAWIQGLHSRYLGRYGDYATESQMSLSVDDTRGRPYLTLPSGNVLIASALPGETSTLGSLSFGGNSGLARHTRTIAFEATNQTSFLINARPSLPTIVYFQTRYEHFDQSLSANRLGSFSYASLGDLAAQRPSSFARTLNTPDRAGGAWRGAAAVGSSWNTPKIVLTGGLRFDANTFTDGATYNSALDRALGIRNDATPSSFAVSPRLGFYWYYKTRGAQMSINNSQFSSVIRAGPQIRGGFGEFRNFLRPDLLADAIGSTGLPGSTQRLLCTGPAAPVPNWQTYLTDPGSIPSTCMGGTSVFTDTAPNVVAVDRSYRPMRSRRGTLGWTSSIFGSYFTIDATYSQNLNQASVIDANFAGATQFTLPTERNRPVFVAPTSIVAATGMASAVESRRTASFGRVANRVSDLRGDARQITAYFVPNVPYRIGFVTLGYTFSDARTQTRGFDQSASLDPRDVEWASSPFTPKHHVMLQLARGLLRGRAALTTSMRFSSGLRYTPSVSGDVNGDGWSGDRAFVFNPASADTGVARGIRELLANGSSSAQSCLERQLGTMAGRNSCLGPWTATMNASLMVFNLPRRASLSVNFANPLGGLDQLLHGSSKLRGWGATPFVDGTLYQIRGFDAAARRYTYQVNSRFGSTSPATTTFRTPFRMTVDISMALGHNTDEQAVVLNMRIKPPLAGTRATADTIKNRYMNGSSSNSFSDIYRVMLRYADSLALSRDQSERMQARQKWLISQADSVFGDLAKHLAALPQDFSAKDAAARVKKAQDDMWTIIYAEKTFLTELLTPGQIRLLPGGIRDMIMVPNYRGRFFYGF